jgi:uncharacterized membrane protein
MKRNFFGLTIILALLGFWAVSIYMFPFMPDSMISHWGLGGSPDGYADKALALFLAPVLATIFSLVFLVIRSAKSVNSFRNAFDRFIIVFLLFFFYLHSFVLLWNLGSEVPLVPYFTSLFGILWYSVGALIAKSEPNPWIGIRTPWTFENPKIWEKTNQLAGSGFRLASLFAFVTAFAPAAAYAIWLVVIPPVLIVVFSVFYSYLIRRS